MPSYRLALALWATVPAVGCSMMLDTARLPTQSGADAADVATEPTPCSGQTLCAGNGGYCADLTVDPLNCGSCGNVCLLTNASAQCLGGGCVVGSCRLGFGNCDDSPTNGCETPLGTAANCGSCGAACPNLGEICAAGSCACPLGTTDCGTGYCVDTNWDPSRCGRCDVSCAPGELCVFGRCTCNSLAGRTACSISGMSGTVCTNLMTDPLNCGMCGWPCVTGEACAAGVCITACPGAVSCGYSCTDTNSDPFNCGGCDILCLGGFCEFGCCREIQVPAGCGPMAGPGGCTTTCRCPSGFDCRALTNPDGSHVSICLGSCP